MDWNDEIIARLRGLWAEGHSTAEIGRRLGVSKNAIVGKAHRLNLPPRPSPIRRDGVPGARPRNLHPRRVTGPTLPSLAATEVASSLALSDGPPPGSSASEIDHPGEPAPAPYRPEAQVADAVLPDTHRSEAADVRAEAPRTAALAAPSRPSSVRVVPPRSSRLISCCWPLGEPGTKTFRFCDSDATPGKPYCQTHAQLAYVRVRDRREDAA